MTIQKKEATARNDVNRIRISRCHEYIFNKTAVSCFTILKLSDEKTGGFPLAQICPQITLDNVLIDEKATFASNSKDC